MTPGITPSLTAPLHAGCRAGTPESGYRPAAFRCIAFKVFGIKFVMR
jgi:hypothetical protein